MHFLSGKTSDGSTVDMPSGDLVDFRRFSLIGFKVFWETLGLNRDVLDDVVLSGVVWGTFSGSFSAVGPGSGSPLNNPTK